MSGISEVVLRPKGSGFEPDLTVQCLSVNLPNQPSALFIDGVDAFKLMRVDEVDGEGLRN